MVNSTGGITLSVMNRFPLSLVLLLTVHCGGAVAPDAPIPETARAPSPEWRETASCEEIARTCGGDPARVVRGHSAGLDAFDGSRVEFAVRYLEREGEGLDVPHGVALGRTHVKGGSFSTCVCVPHGANMYPQIAAVVYRVGSTTETPRDAVRATFSERYATLGDEDVGYALNAVPSAAQTAAAVAAMVARTADVTLKNLEDGTIVAGIVSDERPVAAQLAHGGSFGGVAGLSWTMPGRASSSERVAFFIDRNRNGVCDAGDRAAFAPMTGAFDGTWLSDIKPVCDALQPEAPRE